MKELSITATVPDDFTHVQLGDSDAYDSDTKEAMLSPVFGLQVLSLCRECVTFKDGDDVIGIVGVSHHTGHPELFSYLSPRIKDFADIKHLRFCRKFVEMLSPDLCMYVESKSKRAKSFAQFLGFKDTGVTYKSRRIYSR